MSLDQLLYLGSLLLRYSKRFFRRYGWRIRRFFKCLFVDVALIGVCAAVLMTIWCYFFN